MYIWNSKSLTQVLLALIAILIFNCTGPQTDEADLQPDSLDSLLIDAVNASREKSFDVAFKKLNHVIEEAKEAGDLKTEIIGNINLGNLYLYYNSEEEGLSYLFYAQDLAEKNNLEDNLTSIYNNIAIVYSTNGKLELAKEYFNKALNLNKKLGARDKTAINLINLGIVMEELKEYSKANEFCLQALEIFEEYKDTVNISVVLNSIGNIYYNENKFEAANNHYKQALSLIETQPVHLYLPTFNLNYGRTQYKFGNYDTAAIYIHRALDSFMVVKNTEEIIECYDWLAKTYEKSFDEENASLYYNSCIAWKDTLLAEKRSQWISETEMKYEFGKKEKEIEWLERRARQEKLIWGGSILALLIISTLLIYSFKVKNTNLAQKNIILQKEQEFAQLEIVKNKLEQEKLRQELEMKNRELAAKALHLVNKNEMLNSMTSMLDKIDTQGEAKNADLVRNVKRTITQNINLDEQWEDFKVHFEEVHSNFFKKLITDYPVLSKTDLRLCAYLLINLDAKEIAQISNISPDSVRKRKQRLREKLNLSKDQDIRILLHHYERA